MPNIEEVITTVCPKCSSKISHVSTDTPRRCVGCKTKFVSAEDVVVLEGKNPPTIVQIEPVHLNAKGNGGN